MTKIKITIMELLVADLSTGSSKVAIAFLIAVVALIALLII